MATGAPREAYEAAGHLMWILGNKINPNAQALDQTPRPEVLKNLVEGMFMGLLEVHKAHVAMNLPSPIESFKTEVENHLKRSAH